MLDALRRLAGELTACTDRDELLATLVRGLEAMGDGCPVRLGDSGRAVKNTHETLVPILRAGNVPVAAMHLGDDQHAPSRELVEAAGLAASLAAALLGQLELSHLALNHGARLALLNDVTRAINAAETVEDAILRAAEGSAALLGCPELALYRIENGLLVLRRHAGAVEHFPATLHLVDRNGRALLGNSGPPLRLGVVTLDDARGLVQVLRDGRRAEGVLVLRGGPDREEWTDDERSLGDSLAETLRLAVAKIQLIERSQREAAFDALTGVASRRHFMRELARETERVRRQGSPLSLLMVDADHFKNVNDTWGHGAGDEVLRALARALEAGTRSLDVVGRLGGEELGVLLPGAELSTATMVAERLRASVEATEVAWREEILRVTVSIGVAEWDGEMNYEDLLEAADAALYRSKAEGRNRVTAANSLETLIDG